VLGGLCYTASYIIGPGVVKASGGSIIFGELDNQTSERSKELEKVINSAIGISGKSSLNIQFDLWKKFAWISSASAIGAVTRAPANEWRKIAETRNLFEGLLHEAFAVAQARNVCLGDAEFQETIEFLDKLPDQFTTSLQRDIMANKRSELQQQIGEIVRLGEELNVSVPLSKAIYASLLPGEIRARS
jgi:2-dehydropantoate 2-reductase